MTNTATAPPKANIARSWTPLNAAAVGLASLAVLIFLVMLTTPLAMRRVPGLTVYQLEQLSTLLVEAGTAAALAGMAARVTGKQGLAGLAKSVGWGSGRPAVSLWAASGALTAAIIHVLLVAVRGTAGHLSVGDFICAALPEVFVAPLLEESYFRGILLPSLARKLGPGVSLVLVTLVSSLLHLGQMFYVMPAMALFGIIWLRTKSLDNCCAAHVAYNLCLSLLVLR